ncbi:MAG TPA: hypothetical protein VHD56_08905, partial [Tepidisphaeraceae bacterium]|nr:hypothetical protein [Tepidisphaeraceae bacterium]
GAGIHEIGVISAKFGGTGAGDFQLLKDIRQFFPVTIAPGLNGKGMGHRNRELLQKGGMSIHGKNFQSGFLQAVKTLIQCKQVAFVEVSRCRNDGIAWANAAKGGNPFGRQFISIASRFEPVIVSESFAYESSPFSVAKSTDKFDPYLPAYIYLIAIAQFSHASRNLALRLAINGNKYACIYADHLRLLRSDLIFFQLCGGLFSRKNCNNSIRWRRLSLSRMTSAMAALSLRLPLIRLADAANSSGMVMVVRMMRII